MKNVGEEKFLEIFGKGRAATDANLATEDCHFRIGQNFELRNYDPGQMPSIHLW